MYCINPAYVKYDLKNEKIIFDSYNPKRNLTNSKLISCGKCINCLKNKVSGLSVKVQKQMNKEEYKYCYLFTITFNDSNQMYFINKNKLDLLLEKNDDISKYSPYTTLSKNKINNVIRNLKKKMNNYYKCNVAFSYLLSGEYGSKTGRAHYHILLMLSHEIPELKLEKITAKDNLKHYKSKILNSKQYDLYDLVIVNNYKKTAIYVSKYLMKQQDKDKDKYVKYSTKKEKFIFKQVIQDFELDIENIKKQAPFIKKSQKLGIYSTLLENIKNDTLTPYYFKKYWLNFVFQNKKIKNISIYDLEFFNLLKKQFVFKDKKSINFWFSYFKRKIKNDYFKKQKQIFDRFIWFIDLNYEYFQNKDEKYNEKVENYKKYYYDYKKTLPKLKDLQYNYISKDNF